MSIRCMVRLIEADTDSSSWWTVDRDSIWSPSPLLFLSLFVALPTKGRWVNQTVLICIYLLSCLCPIYCGVGLRDHPWSMFEIVWLWWTIGISTLSQRETSEVNTYGTTLPMDRKPSPRHWSRVIFMRTPFSKESFRDAFCEHVCMCVCVSTPVPKGSTLFLVLNASSAGGQWSFQQSLPNKDTADRMWHDSGTPESRTCIFQTVHKLSNALFPAAEPRRRSPPQTCQPLSRPTRVLGVILRKEALFSCRKSCHRFIVFFIVNSLNSLSLTTELFE